jgi:uncharacterized protein involved in outer membrane biogenesis
MNKKKIIIFFIIFFAIILLIFDFLKYRINKIVKDLIINKGKEFLCQQIVIGDINSSILESSIKIYDVEIRNIDGFKEKNIIQIKKINLDLKLLSFLTNNILVKNISIENAKLNLELILDNKQIKDNFSTLRKCEKLEEKNNQDKVKKENENKDKKNKTYIVEKLIINNSSIKASSEIFNINKEIMLNNMTFNNLGNIDGAIKFDDVLKMIYANILLNINNEIIQGDLKNKLKDKVKNLRNKISPETLKKLERTFR